MTINDPDVAAELQALCPRYEQALVSNDVQTLLEMFWAGPQVMRFGAAENLYGPEELGAFRRGRPVANLARTVTRMDVVSFGRDFGSITLEFERTRPDGGVTRGAAEPGLGAPAGGLAHCAGSCFPAAAGVKQTPSLDELYVRFAMVRGHLRSRRRSGRESHWQGLTILLLYF
ncbi:MAG TPA: AtzH-like domain-containing protein [Terracidiphilus sp.]|nr:AtzH-like domain-containing protein [Terracidiphilus sp.]